MNFSTALHEAAHAAACIWLDRPVESVSVTTGLGFPGEEVGRCRAPIPEADGIQPRDLGVALVGYWAEGVAGWPPPYAEARQEKREALATLIRVLELDQDQYQAAIDVTRRMLEDEHFRQFQSVLARALSRVPELQAEDIRALCRATSTPIPKEMHP